MTSGSRPDFLSVIVARKRAEIARRRRWLDRLDAVLNPVPFDPARGDQAREALRRAPGAVPRVIAEVKFRSPSAGVLRPRATGDVQRVVSAYAAGGATAVSVLADGPGFGGSILDVRRAAAGASLPVLFKEFVLDECQVRWARAAGASLVLLIVRILDDAALVSLLDATWRAGLEAVVEVQSEAERVRAMRAGARIIGVNARDLSTFAVDRSEAESIVERIPPDLVAVTMSGLRAREDFVAAAAGRADAVLVGEALMRSPDPAAELRAWLTPP